MAEFPYENTLTANVTHQQLTDLERTYGISDGYVTSPARVEERKKGYDVQFNTTKQVVYQYKRPKSVVDRNGEIWFSFPVNTQQVDVLQMRNRIGQAFLVLPLAGTSHRLPRTFEKKNMLEKTVFIDVFSNITRNTSRIYIPITSCNGESIQAKGKFADSDGYRDMNDEDAYYPIRSANILLWERVASQLQKCRLGVLVSQNGQLVSGPETYLGRLEAFESAFKNVDQDQEGHYQAETDGGDEPDLYSELLYSDQAKTVVDTTISELQKAEVFTEEGLENRRESLSETFVEIADADHPPTTSIQDSLDALLDVEES